MAENGEKRTSFRLFEGKRQIFHSISSAAGRRKDAKRGVKTVIHEVHEKSNRAVLMRNCTVMDVSKLLVVFQRNEVEIN